MPTQAESISQFPGNLGGTFALVRMGDIAKYLPYLKWRDSYDEDNAKLLRHALHEKAAVETKKKLML